MSCWNSFQKRGIFWVGYQGIISLVYIRYFGIVYDLLRRISIPYETDSQRRVRNLTHYLRVEEVSNSHKDSATGNRYHDAVQNPKHRSFDHLFAIEIHGNDYSDSSPVARQSLKSREFKFWTE